MQLVTWSRGRMPPWKESNSTWSIPGKRTCPRCSWCERPAAHTRQGSDRETEKGGRACNCFSLPCQCRRGAARRVERPAGVGPHGPPPRAPSPRLRSAPRRPGWGWSRSGSPPARNSPSETLLKHERAKSRSATGAQLGFSGAGSSAGSPLKPNTACGGWLPSPSDHEHRLQYRWVRCTCLPLPRLCPCQVLEDAVTVDQEYAADDGPNAVFPGSL